MASAHNRIAGTVAHRAATSGRPGSSRPQSGSYSGNYPMRRQREERGQKGQCRSNPGIHIQYLLRSLEYTLKLTLTASTSCVILSCSFTAAQKEGQDLQMSANQNFPFLDLVGLHEEIEKDGDFPVAENAATQVLFLLMYPGLSPVQQNRVVEGIERFGKATESSMPLPTSSKSLTGSTSTEMPTAPQ
jgi:hypothetical protein